MSVAVEKKVLVRTAVLEKQIKALRLPRLTNTYKRQQEQRHRDTMIERCQQEKDTMDYLAAEAGQRKLTKLEKHLLVGSFYESMRSLLACRRHNRVYQADYRLELNRLAGETVERLKKVGIMTDDDLDAALDNFAALQEKATEPMDPTAYRLRDLMFQARLCQHGDVQFTPTELAREIVELAGLGGESRVLEPEAGIASLADEIRKVTPYVDCAEISYNFREVLKLKGYPVVGEDFLQMAQTPVYDAVLMNPPFTKECLHIRHAYGFLRQGGVLVSVCCHQMMSPKGRQYVDFYSWLNEQDYRFREVNAKFEATSVKVTLLVIQH